jgi:F-type H+-transporting ATPase subunit a
MKQAARLWMLAAALLVFTLICAAIASAQSHASSTAPTTLLVQGENPPTYNIIADNAAKEEGGEAEKKFELPNFMEWIYELNREPIDAWLASVNANLPPLLHIDWVNVTNLTFVLIILIILCTTIIVASNNRALRPKNRLYIFFELIVVTLYDFFHQVLGSDTRKYIPLIGTLFVYILSMNIFGLIPLMKSPTSVWGINVAMALSVFFYVQWTGITRNGILGYLKHFVGELPSIKEMGCLGFFIVPFLVVLNITLHIIGELIKPLSLSLRLFGNIFGEDTLLAVFASLLFLTSYWKSIPIWILFFVAVYFVFFRQDKKAFLVIISISVLMIAAARLLGARGDAIPLQLPFMFMSVLFSTIQAVIFSMLTSIYIALMLPHEEHGH